MYYPNIDEGNNSRTMIDTWRGYNHNHKIQTGEFFDMENLSSDLFPIMSPRKVRTRITNEAEELMRGIVYANNNIYVLQGTDLWNVSTDTRTDLSTIMTHEAAHTSEQKLLIMGSYLLIFPLKIYVNLRDTSDMGRMESSYECAESITVTYTPCTYSGAALQALTASDNAPQNATHGDYWICTDPDKAGLYYYNGYKSDFEAVPTCYIKITVPGVDLSSYFDVGDAVHMNTKLPDINNGSVIQDIGDGYLVVIGFMNKVTDTETTSSSWKLKFERKVPTLDHMCVNQNRVWGCHYGYDNIAHKTVNEIYCSKLGDFKNWYVFQGLSTDSYTVSVGEIGPFTGCIDYQGAPHFFKENCIYKVHGSFPAEYQVTQQTVEGVQQGSEKSLVVIGQLLMYKGVMDVCVYDGSTPTAVSVPLSREELFYNGKAGCCQNKYYIEMENAKGAKRLFVYDIQFGIWEKEEQINAIAFTESLDGQLYALLKDNVWGIGRDNNAAYTLSTNMEEEYVKWYGITGEMGYEFPDKKYVSRITIRAYVPTRSELAVEVAYDGRDYDEVGTIRGNNDIASQSLTITPFRCDTFKIKLRGHGACMIYSVALTLETGSEE